MLLLFSVVWSENAALIERLVEIHSNPQYYTMALTFMNYYFLLFISFNRVDGP